MENIKKYILHAISRVEDQKYVDAIKTLYELLEKIRNQK